MKDFVERRTYFILLNSKITRQKKFLNQETKNMLRTLLSFKPKKLRTCGGFIKFWCSNKKNCMTQNSTKQREKTNKKNIITSF